MPIYLKIGDIKGESQAEDYREWFDVFAFSMGASNTGGFGGGGGAGKVSVHDISVTKRAEAGSPALFLACCRGEHFAEAFLEVTSGGPEPTAYMQYRMQNVMLTSIQTSGDGGSAPTESLSLNFEKITYRHTVFGPTGTVDHIETMFWDVAKNTGA